MVIFHVDITAWHVTIEKENSIFRSGFNWLSATRNSLNTAIKSTLDTLKGVIINDFKFKIYADESGGNLGVIRVDYVIVPLNEIREVRNRVEISDAI